MAARRRSARLGFPFLAVLAACAGCPAADPPAAPPKPPPRPSVHLEIPADPPAQRPSPDAGRAKVEVADGEAEARGAAADLGPAPAPPPAREPAAPPAGQTPSIEVAHPDVAGRVAVPEGARLERATVIRVVDGDTVAIQGGAKVRLIGMNTPETGEPLAEEATRMLRALVGGKEVLLEEDVERKDLYGRRLAYVFIDGRFVNGELVRRGAAHVYRWEPNVKYADVLLEFQRAARRDRLGIWTLRPPAPSRVYVASRGDHTFHRPDCAIARQFRKNERVEFATRDDALDSGRKPHPRCTP